MGVRAVIAAAVLAVGVGQAEAATVQPGTYTMSAKLTSLTYECTNYGSICDEPKPSTNTGFHGLQYGQSVTGVLSLVVKGSSASMTFAHSGGALNAYGYDVGYGEIFGYWDNPHWFEFWIESGRIVGRYVYGPDGGGWEPHATVQFIAPIPLPASAALLPLGLGTLAVMRKRRRS